MKLIIKNFKCHGEETYEFEKGIVLVKGHSGSGKSSILESINFCLYGNGKKIIKYGQSECEVIIEWDNYRIRRSRNPNQFNIIDNESNKKYEDVSAQSIVNSIFGKHFNKSGYLSQMNTNSFITLNPIEKLKFLESIAFDDNDIEEIKKKRKIMALKFDNDLLEVRSKISMFETMNQIESFNGEANLLVECNFPVVCRVSQRELVEKNANIKIKNECKRIKKNNIILLNKKKEYEDVNILEIRQKDIEKSIDENNQRKHIIESEILNINYDENKYLINRKKSNKNNKKIKELEDKIKSNENKENELYKYSINLKMYNKKKKDIEEELSKENIGDLNKRKDLLDLLIRKKECIIKIKKIEDDTCVIKQKKEGSRQGISDLDKENKDIDEIISKYIQGPDSEMEDTFNLCIDYYKKYLNDIEEYECLKCASDGGDEKKFEAALTKINKEIENIDKEIEYRECIYGNCPACEVPIKQKNLKFILAASDAEHRAVEGGSALQVDSEAVEILINKKKQLDKKKICAYKKVIENELNIKKMNEIEQKYKNSNIDYFKDSPLSERDGLHDSSFIKEKIKYFIDLKNKKKNINNKLNSLNKSIYIESSQIKDNKKKREIEVNNLEDLGREEARLLLDRESARLFHSEAAPVTRSHRVDGEEELSDKTIKELNDILEKTKKEIYKIERNIGEKDKIENQILQTEEKIQKIQQNEEFIKKEDIQMFKKQIDDNIEKDKYYRGVILEMEIEKNKIHILDVEKKRIVENNIKKNNKKDKLLNEHKSKYGDLGEAAPSGGDAQFGTLPLAGVKQNIECIQRILDDSLAVKEENEKLLEEIKKWKEMSALIEKNNNKKKEFEKLKKDEMVCIEYKVAIDILKNKIIETESILLEQLLDSINSYANIYLSGFFQDQIITSELSPYKKLKKSSKNQINLLIYYKGEQCDLNNLSGGEQARIILAYTLAFSEILNPPLIMLDEAMSSLDQDTTDIVSKTIKRNCSNKIVILVAHQVVQGHFDNIIEMENITHL